MTKTALIVAPFFDGSFVPFVPGGEDIAERARLILAKHGGYSVKVLSGPLTRTVFNQELDLLSEAAGSLLFFFFGHGVRRGSRSFLAMSDSRSFDEGISVDEVIATLFRSAAREAIVILDCCHAGAAAPAAVRDLGGDRELSGGRALLAACAENQSAWANAEYAEKPGGVFANILLDGLEGGAARMGKVRASSLIDYAGNRVQQWAQNPVMITNEGGDRFCVITEGFAPADAEQARRSSTSSMRRLGIPFRPSSNFVGREAEIDRLVSLLGQDSGRVSVSATVEGIGGIGKTELIIQLLSSGALKKLFDTVLWIDAAGPIVPQLQEFGSVLGQNLSDCTESNIGSRLAAVLQRFGQCLIVVDNATDWDPIKPLLPTEPALLITTRTQGFGGTQFAHIELEGLSDDAARTLLVDLAPTLANDPNLEALVAALFGHALAIELAGATIRAQDISAAEYLSQGSRMKSSPSAVLRQLRYGKTVEQAIETTWESLSDEHARTLWRRAALFAPTVATKKLLKVGACGTEDIAQEILYEFRDMDDDARSSFNPYLSAEAFEAAYSELKERNVFTRVQVGDGGQWSMHRLIREFGRTRIDNKEYFAHIYSVSDWLARTGKIASIDAPHLVAAVLDGAKFGYQVGARRSRQREIGFRSGLFRSREMVRFIGSEMRDPAALRMLFEGLSDINADVRAEAVSMLAQLSDLEEVREGVAVALTDASPSVRRVAALALLREADARTVDLLARALATNNEAAKIDIIWTLALIGRPDAIEPLVKIRNDSSPVLRDEATIALALCGDERVVPQLLELCANGSTGEIKVRAFEALVRVAPTASAQAINDAALEGRVHDALLLLAGFSSRDESNSTDFAKPEYFAQILPAVATLIARSEFITVFGKLEESRSFVQDMFNNTWQTSSPADALRIILRIYDSANVSIPQGVLEVVLNGVDKLWNTFVENLGKDSLPVARKTIMHIASLERISIYSINSLIEVCEKYEDLAAYEVAHIIDKALKNYGDKRRAIALARRIGEPALAGIIEANLKNGPNNFNDEEKEAAKSAIAAIKKNKIT